MPLKAATNREFNAASRPMVMSVAGLDPSGGAGLTADLVVLERMGVRALTVASLITQQNSTGVLASTVLSAKVVTGQMTALLDDFRIQVIKFGALGNASVVRGVSNVLESRWKGPVVVDPILLSSSGLPLMTREAVRDMRSRLLPRTTLLTANVPEASVLTQHSINDREDLRRAGMALLNMGPQWVLCKGGHLPDSRSSADLLLSNDQEFWMEAQRIPGASPHGTGCALASACAAGLAHGQTMPQAVEAAKALVLDLIEHANKLGQGKPYLF